VFCESSFYRYLKICQSLAFLPVMTYCYPQLFVWPQTRKILHDLAIKFCNYRGNTTELLYEILVYHYYHDIALCIKCFFILSGSNLSPC
jgi:hypothetical protein